MTYTLECPANDWLCPYFDNGNCTLEKAREKCDAFFELDEKEEDD